MKLSSKQFKLLSKNVCINRRDFSISDSFVKYVFHNIIGKDNKIKYISSKKQRKKLFSIQYEYSRRTLLKYKYYINGNNAKNIKEGFVYAIVNPAYPEHVKVGSSIDVYGRLATYQTASPHRDYELLAYFFSHDRRKSEEEIHNKLNRNGEWCEISRSDALELFREQRKLNKVK